MSAYPETNLLAYDANTEAEIEHPPIIDNDGSAELTVRFDTSATDNRSASERIADLFEHLPGCRNVLLGLLELCRTRQAEQDVISLADREQEKNHSVYSGLTFCRMLEKAGALRHVRENGDSFDEASLQSSIVVENGVEYTQATRPPASYWESTDEGIAYVEADDSTQRVAGLIAEDAAYASVYKFILEQCSKGATGNDLAGVIDEHPLVQNPRFYAMYFIKRLEDRGAIAWDGGWQTTEAGMESLTRLEDIEPLQSK